MRVITLCLVCLAATSLYNRVSAQDARPAEASKPAPDYKLAMGIRLSSASPTLSNSFSVKYFMDDTHAIEGLISFGDSRFGIGALYEKHQLIGGTPAFTWFYGAGGYVGFENNTSFVGPTGIVGLDYKFQNAPLNLSLDWKPELDIIPKINFVPDAFALTVRFVFK
ncbi:MAG TPA: hypothetical protein VGM31_10220 [Puia sp.]|jgi:hypothetical protein